MTPTEINDELKAIKNEAGIRAWVDVAINPDRGEKFVSATLYPFGVGRDEGYVNVTDTTFEGAIRLLKETWASRREQHRAEAIKRMALAIIRHTADHGECTDAALRNEFEPNVVEEYAEAAVAKANEMAANGPFKVKRTRKANAA
jgi:hypothetical protein